ncbi:uncharacterized protein [Nicotiana tomentosiformis]|uniref:uncharacterized protein n=1 Tax=Nicotiana tomentosiformis TaxID=4098 RepID=UPI00388CC7BE
MANFFHHLAGTMYDHNEMNFEKMRKMGGVEFEGTVDPTDAEQWLECIWRVFEQLDCSEGAIFKILHIPHAYRDAKKKEFLDLKQRGMSIAKYQQKFLRLSRYAGVALTWERIGKEQVRRNENRFRKANSDYGGPSKRGKFNNFKTGGVHTSTQHKQNRSNVSTASSPRYGQGKNRIPTCAECGKNHFSTCMKASSACFNCGSFDHQVKDCPNPNPISSPCTEGSV